VGLEASRREATRLLEEARAAIAPLGKRAAPLVALADFVGARRH
jgi:geranylgeranyl diphosphate synthase type II